MRRVVGAMMRSGIAAVLCAAAFPAEALDLRVEAGGGVSSTFRDSVPLAPLVTLAVTYTGDLWSAGVRGIGILGPQGAAYTPHGAALADSSGFQAWAVLIDGRLHTSGAVQAGIGPGIGFGQIIRIQQNAVDETPALDGNPGLVLKASGDVRLLPYGSRWSGSFEFGVLLFTRVHPLPPFQFATAEPGTFVPAVYGLFSLAYSL